MTAKIRAFLNLESETEPACKILVNTLPALNDLTIESLDYYALFFDICHINLGHRGLQDALPGLSELIKTVVADDRFSEMERSETLTFLDSFICKVVADERFSGSPVQNENVMTYYLGARRRQIIGQPIDGEKRWETLQLVGYVALNRAIRESLRTQQAFIRDNSIITAGPANTFKPETDEQMLESARAIDKCLKFVNLEDLHCVRPTILRPKAIKKALKTAAKQGSSFPTMHRIYQRIAIKLLGGNSISRKRFTIKQMSHKFGSFNGQLPLKNLEIVKIKAELENIYATNSGKLSRKKSEAAIRRSFEYKEQIERIYDGESEEEQTTPPPPNSDAFNLRSYLGLYARFTRPNGWSAPFSRSYLTLETASIIISFAFQNYQENFVDADSYLELLAFLMTQLFFGFDEKLLMKIEVRETASTSKPTDETPLIYSRDGFFHIKPRKYDGKSPFGTLKAEYKELYLSGSHILTIPAPLFLKNILSELLAADGSRNERLFPYPNTNKLNKLLDPLRITLHQNFDLKKFGATASKHLAFTGEMDDLSVAFISGYIPHHLGAQPHYRNIKMSDLAVEHLTACEKIWQLIIVSEESLGDLLDTFRVIDVQNLFDPCEASDITAIEQKRFGSFFVPRLLVIKNYLDELKSFIEGCADPIKKFNCYTAYTALLLMILTGVRAVEVGRLESKDIYFSGEDLILVIDGKSNRFFDEWRLASLNADLSYIITEYQKHVTDILHYIHNGKNVFPSESHENIAGKLFFFLDDNGGILPVESKSFNNILKKVLPSYGCISAYNYRINAPRQFFATTAADLGINRRLIDALMGHTTRGREPLFKFSDLSFDEIREASRKISAHIASLIDLRSPR